MLKSLDLFGFKSFADRTQFEFAAGVTGVVGPNGSGKSNVVDAIKWILGDQSAKSLRGTEMTDVIFNGSATRKPAGFAEATLTFDNSRNVFNLPSQEVQVGRRIYRSGEAEYLINRTPARLKDIKDLLLGTGAGTSAYSIIEQGRVDQLLQATAINRRLVFEEAAGISRFKVKKVDAQRKLERVAQNLLRLTDIVNEVQSQLTAVRSQAAKAAKYRETSLELRTLRVGLAADDFRELTSQLQAVSSSREALQTRIAEVQSQSQEFETAQHTADEQATHFDDELRAAERRAAENREAIAGHEATLKHFQNHQRELDEEYQRLERQQQELAARVDDVSGELRQTEGSLARFADEFSERQQRLAARERDLQQGTETAARLRRELDDLRQRLLDAVRRNSVFEHRLANLSARCQQLDERKAAALELKVSSHRLVDACERDVARRRKTLDAASARLTDLRLIWTGARDGRQALARQHAEIHDRVLELREARSAAQARRHLLEDLEQRQEGLGVGVKEILTRARESDKPPWSSVLGLVTELLDVEIEHAPLIEVALGARAQLIVLRDTEPLIDFLKQGRHALTGRVGFLALADQRPALAPAVFEATPGEDARVDVRERSGWGACLKSPAWPDFRGRPGVIARADTLVRAAPSVPQLPAQLLADAWIVETLPHALALAASAAAPCRFVTLQGEYLDERGTLFAGTMRSETSLVSRKSELRTVRNELQRLDRQILAEEQDLGRLGQEAQRCEQRLQKAQADIDELNSGLAELRAAVSAKEAELERLSHQRDEAQRDCEKLTQDESAARGELEATRAEHQAAQAECVSVQARSTELDAALLACENARQALQTELIRERAEVAKFEERMASLQSARTRLDHERLQRDLHREEAELRFAHLAERREKIERERQGLLDQLELRASATEALNADVLRLQTLRDEVRQTRTHSTAQEVQLRHQARDLKERLHALDMRATEHRHQLATLAERLRDEYQLELAEVAAEGASARAAHAAEVAASQVAETTRSADHDTSSVPSQPATPAEALAVAATDQSGDPVRQTLEERIQRCRRILKQLGAVNADSLRDLDELENRYARISGQLADLVSAKSTLEEIIRRINTESKRLFSEAFQQIRTHFQELFRKLFGGGEGDIVLEDPEDLLECGIDVVARPPGKELRSISLLSGGEKTMTAVALLLAIFKSKPSPFCILDEVDAALDEGNVERYMGVIREFQQWTQFIVITHSKRTMSSADVLYGVTMEEAGVSKRMSVRFEDIGADGNFRSEGGGGSALSSAA